MEILSAPELPITPGQLYSVHDETELRAAFDETGPRTIRLEVPRIDLEAFIELGGLHGGNSEQSGHDVTIDLNGGSIRRYGIEIERGCDRVLIKNGSMYCGQDHLPEGLPKAAMPDPITIVGETALDRPAARNITFENVAMGLGTDIIFQCAGDNVLLDRCFVFSCLASHKHPKGPHSKNAMFDQGSIAHSNGIRINGTAIQSIFAFSDDRSPRVAGGVNFAMLDCLSVGSRLGMSIDDHAIGTGHPLMLIQGCHFITANQRHWDGRLLATRAATIYAGTKPETRIHFADNKINGVAFDTQTIWDSPLVKDQECFGAGCNSARTPIVNRAYDGSPIAVPWYVPMSEQDKVVRLVKFAGNPHGDPIQSWAKKLVLRCFADPGNVECPLLTSESKLGLFDLE